MLLLLINVHILLTVGYFSSALKEALGVSESQPELPDFILRMRVFGYPPGHRLAAEDQVRLQLLSMYDAQGHGDER